MILQRYCNLLSAKVQSIKLGVLGSELYLRAAAHVLVNPIPLLGRHLCDHVHIKQFTIGIIFFPSSSKLCGFESNKGRHNVDTELSKYTKLFLNDRCSWSTIKRRIVNICILIRSVMAQQDAHLYAKILFYQNSQSQQIVDTHSYLYFI